jgi:hypothetical protein
VASVNEEDHLAIAIAAEGLEVGDVSLDRDGWEAHAGEDLATEPVVAKTGPSRLLPVASVGAAQALHELGPTQRLQFRVHLFDSVGRLAFVINPAC